MDTTSVYHLGVGASDRNMPQLTHGTSSPIVQEVCESILSVKLLYILSQFIHSNIIMPVISILLLFKTILTRPPKKKKHNVSTQVHRRR